MTMEQNFNFYNKRSDSVKNNLSKLQKIWEQHIRQHMNGDKKRRTVLTIL